MFCEISDLSIPWKKIGRGLPRGKRYADDRTPTIEEIKTILNISPPISNKRICRECEKSGYKIEVIILTTYRGWDSNLVNLDSSRHVHFFNKKVMSGTLSNDY
jgi:hypothetical protein